MILDHDVEVAETVPDLIGERPLTRLPQSCSQLEQQLDERLGPGGRRGGRRLELEARAVNGGIHVDYPVTVSGLISSRRELRGTIGNGGPRIRASATNGGISITRR